MLRVIPLWLVPVLALGLTMLAFAEGVFDALPPPPVETEPGEALAEADRLYREGQVTLALSHLQRAADAIGQSSAILIGMARCHMRLGRYGTAERNLGEAIEVRLRELGYDPHHIRKVLHERAQQVRNNHNHNRSPQRAQPATGHPGLSATLFTDSRGAARTEEPPLPSPAELALASRLSDAVLSVALTDMARIELVRAARYANATTPRTKPAWLPASMYAPQHHHPSSQDPTSEAERRRQRARHLLQGALDAAPHNTDAQQLANHARKPTGFARGSKSDSRATHE